MFDKEVDIKENYIKQLDDNLMSILLKDMSSGKNIVWATDNYHSKGNGYYEYQEITVKAITGRYGSVVKPRIEKSKADQQRRIKTKAEVFTPSWICNEMNNALDKDFFEKEEIFNKENGLAWITNSNKIQFPDNKTWKDYVNNNVLEITCGEAPYLVSRYDTTTGDWIEVNDRIGLLDRKLRVVNENTTDENDWYEWTVKAYKSTYGYEWQGDSLLIARENLLFTFMDYYYDRFKVIPAKEKLTEIAKILAWNIWQMDGLKYVIPNSCKPIPKMQLSFFDEDNVEQKCPGCEKGNNNNHTGIYCKIKDWNTNRAVKFINIVKGK